MNPSIFCFHVFGKVVDLNKGKKIPEQTHPKKLHLGLENLKNMKKSDFSMFFAQKWLNYFEFGKPFLGNIISSNNINKFLVHVIFIR